MQSFTATATISPSGSPARAWVDAEGVSHTRGQVLTGTVAGGISGTVNVLDNSNIDVTGTGDDFGSFEIATFNGGWEGRYSGTFSGGVLTGGFVGQGTGAMDGMKIMGSFVTTGPGVFVLQGMILNPHG